MPSPAATALSLVRLPVSSSSMARLASGAAGIIQGPLRLDGLTADGRRLLVGARAASVTPGSHVHALTFWDSPTVSFSGSGCTYRLSAGAAGWADSAAACSSCAMTSAGVSTSDEISRKACKTAVSATGPRSRRDSDLDIDTTPLCVVAPETSQAVA